MRIEKVRLKDVGPFADVTLAFPKGNVPKLADVYLLVGPNGCGKSTVLYAIAGLIRHETVALGPDRCVPRLTKPGALAGLMTSNPHRRMAVARYDPDDRRKIDVLEEPFLPGVRLSVWEGRLGLRAVPYIRAKPSEKLDDEWQTFSGNQGFFGASSTRDDQPARWAAFAYAGGRTLEDVRVEAISEPSDDPYDDCLAFTTTTNSSRLAHWIASQHFKRLKAKEAGKLERAAQLEKSVGNIERVIREIVEQDFAFVMSDEDNNVRAR